MLADALRDVDRARWFTFDMSVPDMLPVRRARAFRSSPATATSSPTPALYDEADGVWLDDFDGGFITEERIATHLRAGKHVAVVSPELHGRDHRRGLGRSGAAGRVWSTAAFILCTDHPPQRRGGLRMSTEIKAVVFDMDGVLIDAREWHYEALNRALGLLGYEITRYEHLTTYDGLPTKRKLADAHRRARACPRSCTAFMNSLKQQYTLELVATRCKPVFHHQYALSQLKAGRLQASASRRTRCAARSRR